MKLNRGRGGGLCQHRLDEQNEHVGKVSPAGCPAYLHRRGWSHPGKVAMCQCALQEGAQPVRKQGVGSWLGHVSGSLKVGEH